MNPHTWQQIRVVDTHTAGEPTRVVIHGGPFLGHGSLVDQRERFRTAFDPFRTTVVGEPRGSDVLVGALLVPPTDPSCIAGVIFFNNVGFLSMCGHGTIGVVVALGYLNKLQAGVHKLETPVGIVGFEFDGARTVTLDNVPSYRYRAAVPVTLDDGSTVIGDIAWGGNWFYLVHDNARMLDRDHAADLTAYCTRIRRALDAAGIRGDDGKEIDHIELCGSPDDPAAHSRNFVLCPGYVYDRSPCGTGTSARLACLAADGKLAPGDTWLQEGVLGTSFAGRYARIDANTILPTITGAAYITAEATLLHDPLDPFALGIRS